MFYVCASHRSFRLLLGGENTTQQNIRTLLGFCVQPVEKKRSRFCQHVRKMTNNADGPLLQEANRKVTSPKTKSDQGTRQRRCIKGILLLCSYFRGDSFFFQNEQRKFCDCEQLLARQPRRNAIPLCWNITTSGPEIGDELIRDIE